MSNPDKFFSDLGDEAAKRIDDLTAALAGDDPPDEGYMQKVGRLNMARLRAQEMVLAEMLTPAPEGGMDEEEEV